MKSKRVSQISEIFIQMRQIIEKQTEAQLTLWGHEEELKAIRESVKDLEEYVSLDNKQEADLKAKMIECLEKLEKYVECDVCGSLVNRDYAHKVERWMDCNKQDIFFCRNCDVPYDKAFYNSEFEDGEEGSTVYFKHNVRVDENGGCVSCEGDENV